MGITSREIQDKVLQDDPPQRHQQIQAEPRHHLEIATEDAKDQTIILKAELEVLAAFQLDSVQNKL